MRGQSASVAVLNFPSGDAYMSPRRMRVLARTLNKAAADCEAKIVGRLLDAPVELEYEMDFDENLLDVGNKSLMIKMVKAFGVARFTTSDLHQILKPERYPAFIAEDSNEIERAAANMEHNGMFTESRGPRGGKGWVLTDAAVVSAKRLAGQSSTEE